jgi:hypothetical protein
MCRILKADSCVVFEVAVFHKFVYGLVIHDPFFLSWKGCGQALGCASSLLRADFMAHCAPL